MVLVKQRREVYGETKEVTEFETKIEKDTRTEREGWREPGTGTVGAKALRRVHIYIQELTISAYM